MAAAVPGAAGMARWPRFWHTAFADECLEEQFKARRQSRITGAHRACEWVLAVAATIFVAIGSLAPASLVFRANNWLSWAWCAATRKLLARYPSMWRHFDNIVLGWGLHHVTYQSLTFLRAHRLLFLAGIVRTPTAQRPVDACDEAYQLLFDSLAIIAVTTHGCLSLAHAFILVVSAPCIYVLQILTLGTCLSPAGVVKHVLAYSLICCLAYLGAQQAELHHRQLFLQERELTEELAREREWHRCFGRILASNFDYSSTLDRGLMLAEDMRLSNLLGTVVHAPLHICELAKGEADKKRMREFFDALRDQVLTAQDVCHGPEMLSFGLNVDANVDVDMQVLWVPGSVKLDPSSLDPMGPAQPSSEKAWPVGSLWVCLRQRQLEELRRAAPVKAQHSSASSTSSGEDPGGEGLLEGSPDFTLTFEAGSPRFTILGCSPGSPLQHAVDLAPDLLDWLPLRYVERFSAWVEESVQWAPEGQFTLSTSFGAFHLEPPCSDWHALRVQRALLEIPEWDNDEGKDLPVTLRLMGVQTHRGQFFKETVAPAQTRRRRTTPLPRRSWGAPAGPPRAGSSAEAIPEGAAEEDLVSVGDSVEVFDALSSGASTSELSEDFGAGTDDATESGLRWRLRPRGEQLFRL